MKIRTVYNSDSEIYRNNLNKWLIETRERMPSTWAPSWYGCYYCRLNSGSNSALSLWSFFFVWTLFEPKLIIFCDTWVTMRRTLRWGWWRCLVSRSRTWARSLAFNEMQNFTINIVLWEFFIVLQYLSCEMKMVSVIISENRSESAGSTQLWCRRSKV